MGGRFCQALHSDESDILVSGERGVIDETEQWMLEGA